MRSPRGMVNAALALAHPQVGRREDIAEVIEYCLLCGACTEVCASKVPVPEVLLKARAVLREVSSEPWDYTQEEKDGFNTAFNCLCALTEERENGKGRQVAYFFSSEARLTDIEAAARTVRLLSRVAAVDLVNNDSAGFNALASGHLAELRASLKNNIQLFADYERIIVDSAVSYDTLKKAAIYFAADDEWCEKAAAFGEKLRSLTEYLAETGYQPEPYAGRLTYHECYHLGHGQKVKNQPRALLKQTGSFTEMAASDAACTGHGRFNKLYPQTAASLLAKKTENIEACGAEIVVTECYECLAALKQAAAVSGKFKALHISEVL